MRSGFSLCVAGTISLLVHAAVVLMPPSMPVVGKNVPAMTYRARARLLGVRLAPPAPPVARPTDAVPTIAPLTQAAPTIVPLTHAAPAFTPPSQLMSAASEEGRIDAELTKFVEVSERYFSRDELDVRAAVLDPPDLGAMALSPLLEGRAVLVFYLNELGSVDRIEVEESTLPPSMLDQLRAQQEQVKFSPGSINGVDVKSVVRFEIVLTKQATTTELTREQTP